MLPAQAPHDEAESAVGVEAESHVSGGVEFALELLGATQSRGGSVRHLKSQTPRNKPKHTSH